MHRLKMGSKRWGCRVAKLIDNEEILAKTWDCCISIGGQTIKAHRWILAAQSPRLREELISQKGKTTATVTISTAFPAQAVESVVRYCYQGYLNEETLKGEGAEAIYELTHVLGMDDLKGAAEEGLASSVDAACIVRRVKLAEEYSAVKLMTACASFLALDRSVLDSAEWTALMEEKPLLIAKLLKRAMLGNGPHPDNGSDVDYMHRKTMMQLRNEKISLLYGDLDTVDCEIRVGGVVFRAHKCFLMVHSPVFLEMFSHPETGVNEERSIPNPEAFREILRYCYQGGVPSWSMEGVGEELEVPVFQLANKYCIYGLKDTLERGFADGLSKENVGERFALADTHFAHRLQKACTNLISSMLDDDLVLETNGDW